MDPTVLARMVLTPAEWTVVREQADSLIVASQELREAAEKHDLLKIAQTYGAIFGYHDYVGDLLNAKAGVALREIMKEQQQ